MILQGDGYERVTEMFHPPFGCGWFTSDGSRPPHVHLIELVVSGVRGHGHSATAA